VWGHTRGNDASLGVFLRKNDLAARALRATMSHARTKPGEVNMKDTARKVASSSALAHALALTALLIIASCIFYIR